MTEKVYRTFSTVRPECRAKDRLQVTGGTFDTMGMPLFPDGFSVADAKQFNTSDETVTCSACGKSFPLDRVRL